MNIIPSSVKETLKFNREEERRTKISIMLIITNIILGNNNIIVVAIWRSQLGREGVNDSLGPPEKHICSYQTS